MYGIAMGGIKLIVFVEKDALRAREIFEKFQTVFTSSREAGQRSCPECESKNETNRRIRSPFLPVLLFSPIIILSLGGLRGIFLIITLGIILHSLSLNRCKECGCKFELK
jgi:hypothetical protein